MAASWRSLVGAVCDCWGRSYCSSHLSKSLLVVGGVGAVAGWRSSVLLPVGGRRCCCRLEVAGAVAGSRSSVLLLESLALFCSGLLCARWLVIGSVLWWASLCLVATRWPAGAMVHCYVDVILSDGAIPKASVLLVRLLQEENDEEEEEDEEVEDEEFEDFIGDEDEELGVGDMCLDDRSTSSKGLAKRGRRLIRLMNSRSTPSNTTPSTSASPSPTLGTTSIPNRTFPLPNPDGSPFSSPRIQIPVFNSEQSLQLDMDACHSISSAIQLENPPNLDYSTEEKYAPKLSETQATQSTQATFDGSTPSTLSEPSYYKQMKIWIDANGLAKQGQTITQTLKAYVPSKIVTILPNLPPPIPVINSLSKSEDGGEDENDDDGGDGGGGADE
ncbi:hypothetical protein Cgig2_031130 [Carnegiea gigantea]|uniref:Uncharacterized protein n=1 Tax=Carnegiea gigantea TaxID=171969 RepID=A0A9Q1GLD2_9CARY|nr:hypothetical protein Cgig2_031130 [Carnegiea gigantea]